VRWWARHNRRHGRGPPGGRTALGSGRTANVYIGGGRTARGGGQTTKGGGRTGQAASFDAPGDGGRCAKRNPEGPETSIVVRA
jgi:hypothetical protein